MKLMSPPVPGGDGSALDLATCTVTGDAKATANATGINVVQLQVKNSFNEFTSLTNASRISVDIIAIDNQVLKGELQVIVVNATLGKFNISYSKINWGQYSLVIKIDDSHVSGSPFRITSALACLSPCVNGACKQDGTCACNLGYTGETCASQFALTTAGLDTSNGVIGFSLGVISAISCFLCSLLVWVFRKKKIVRASSPPLQLVIGLGLFIWSFFPIFSALVFSANVPCYVAPVVFHLGFTIAFTTILLKNIRILLIFSAGYIAFNLV